MELKEPVAIGSIVRNNILHMSGTIHSGYVKIMKYRAAGSYKTKVCWLSMLTGYEYTWEELCIGRSGLYLWFDAAVSVN